ncbi:MULTISPECIES: MFS transporter [Gordonia]|uniref:Putative drug resistance transporter n=1 Tax=Gordonia sihwensis NBRC 108236 TaxID=1223544 RepID=L7LPA1_9ACTN|nr:MULTISPECIES: MFS transporter [Gordonia]AUH68038.1 MFS transporter [Gordonia sp. YC-JH1]MBY4569321.1 MFS transporter [Gordonia sihwensis]WFN92233.1 MFS transporter [Gordonia sihwensis]GAC61873.1 putative drug resistance transporter [Gordonia sihwensis NBRC 108236]
MTFATAWLILVACLAVSLVVAAMAALNTALPDIARATGATTAQMTWIIDGYTLVLAALLLPAGAIGDRIGRKPVLMIGLVVFGIGSLAAVWVDTPTQLILTRVVAGVGAAMIMPATLSLITAGVPREKRALAISIWAGVAGAGAIMGFFVTGVLLNFFGWHSVFITFAASSAATLLLTVTIGSSKDDAPGRFDYIGSLTSMTAIAAVVYGLLEAPHRGWTNPLILICLIGGAAMIAAFIVIELRRSSPLLDVNLFRNRAFAAGSLSVALQFLASFGVFYLLLLQLQLVFGYSALKSAVALFPMVVGVGVFAMIGNLVAVRYSLRAVLATGIAIAAAGVLALGIVDADVYWKLGVMLGVCAVGIGLATAPSTTAIMSNTPLENQGVGSAVNDTARELGAAIGIALAGSILAAGYDRRITGTAQDVHDQLATIDPDAAERAADGVRGSLAGAVEVAGHLPPQASSLAEKITEGAYAAFLPPLQSACLVLGSILLAGAAFLGWFAPRAVLAPEPRLDD